MSQRTGTEKESSTFGRLLSWTVVLALVFSAGLITGQRLLRRQAMPPLVSLTSTNQAHAADKPDAKDEEKKRLKTTFSFYEHLTKMEGQEAVDEQDADDPEEEAREPAEKAAEKPAEETTDETAGEPADEPAKENAPDEKADGAPEVADAAEEAQPTEETTPPSEPSDDGKRDVEAAPAEEGNTDDAKTPDEAAPTQKLVDTVKKALDEPAEKTNGESLPARYTLQVGAHPDRTSAENELDRLRAKGLEPHIIMVEIPGRGRVFRVRVGKFHSMDEARNFQGRMKSERGLSSFVTPL